MTFVTVKILGNRTNTFSVNNLDVLLIILYNIILQYKKPKCYQMNIFTQM